MSESLASLPPTPAAIAPSLIRAFGGIWRLTYPEFFRARRVLVLGGLSVVLYLLTVQNVRLEGAGQFLDWATDFYLRVLVPIVALLSAAGAIRDDMGSVSVDYTLTRPVRRPVFVTLRYVSQMVCLQASGLVPFAALVLAGHARDVSGLGGLATSILAAQMLAIAGFSSLGFFLGALTARYFPLAIAYGLIVEVGVGNIPTQVSRLSMTHHVLALQDALLSPATAGVATAASACGAIALFVVLALGGAVAVFSLREFTGAGTAEK